MKACILSSWSGDGTENNPYHPSLFDIYPLPEWTYANEITGPQDLLCMLDFGSLPIAQQVEVAMWFTAVESTPAYYVIWDEPNPKPPSGNPSATERKAMRDYLELYGVSKGDAALLTAPGQSRKENAGKIRKYLKDKSEGKNK